MKTIKIWYADAGLYTRADMEKFFLTKLLKTKYKVELTDHPDYLFYNVFGNEHHRYDCVRIFYTGENVVPNFNYCDYALGFHHLTFEDRYMRLPLWAWKNEAALKLEKKEAVGREALNRRFCNQVVSNIKQTDGMREAFFERLNAYKTVDSGGKYKNNVGGPVADKRAFQARYKFSLAFENIAARGYCTEKIFDAFRAGSVPVYYGDETAVADFNPEAFINVHDYASIDEAVEAIQKLDSDDTAYLKMLNAPVYKTGRFPVQYGSEAILDFLSGIIEAGPVAARRRTLIKPYADIDYTHIKNRDLRLILKHILHQTGMKLCRFFYRKKRG